MRKRSEGGDEWESQFERIIGLGERSYRKSYYPELQRKLAELKKKNTELEAKNAQLEQYAYTVSHDLKTPLITIHGFLGVLQDAKDTGDWEDFDQAISRIAAATSSMSALLDDLLELSRIGRLVNVPQCVPFSEVVEEALNHIQGAIAGAGARVHVEPDLPVVAGDRNRLVEVVQNLVDNAVRYSTNHPHPNVYIGGRRVGREAVFFVRDEGIGIDRRYHDRVFELFRRLDPKCPGTGIGLTLVKRIVEVHGGRIWVESLGPGRGSTFWFTIPDLAESDSSLSE